MAACFMGVQLVADFRVATAYCSSTHPITGRFTGLII